MTTGKPQTQETFVITLRGNRAGTAPIDVRLRKLLKIALRIFDLKCLSVRPGGEQQPTNSETTSRQVPG